MDTHKTKSVNGFNYNGVDWVVDPLKKYTHIDPVTLAHSVGIIPTFIHASASDIVAKALKEYRFGSPEMTGSTISPEGIHSYPEDPDLYPIMSAHVQDMAIHIYPHGIIAFASKETHVYRMD